MIMYSQFKHVNVGAVFSCNGTIYTKVSGRTARITMPEKAYNGNVFYFGWTELCKVIANNA